MNRISSLFVASALAILPIGAFAQQTAAPVKTTGPSSITTMPPAAMTPTTTLPATMSPAKATGKMSDSAAANVTQPAKTDLKTPAHGVKNEVHGMKSHAAKSNVQHVKAEVPAKS